jgi:hypothetical protein
MRAAVLGTAAVAILWCACAPLPAMEPTDLSGWTSIEAPGMRLVGRVEPRELRRLAHELGVFTATTRHFVRAPADRSPAPVTLYCISDSNLLHLFHSRFVGGQMIPDLDGFFGTVAVHGHHFATRQVLFHEYTHFLLRADHRFAYPGWFDEGMSEYLSTLRVRDDAILMGAPPDDRLQWIRAKGLVPIEELLDPTRDSKTLKDVFHFYATSWILVHFLMSSPEGRKDLSDFASRLRRGEKPGRAARHAFRWPLSTLQPRVEAHAMKLAGGVSYEFVFDVRRIGATPSWKERRLGPDEIGYELGALALRMEREEGGRQARAASRLLELALAADPGNARIEAGLAESLALRGKLDAARALLEQALSRGLEDAPLLVHAGRTYELLEADHPVAAAAAQHAFQRAIEMDGKSPVAYAELGRLQRRTGRLPEARKSLERARKRGAWSPELDLDLAAVYVELNQHARARRLLRPLAAYPHSERIADEARRLLDASDS